MVDFLEIWEEKKPFLIPKLKNGAGRQYFTQIGENLGFKIIHNLFPTKCYLVTKYSRYGM